MNGFIYDIPTRIYFGDKLGYLTDEIKKYGKRVLLTYGGGSVKKSGLYGKILGLLEKAGAEVYELSGIAPNPRIESVRAGAKLCKEKNIDVLLAVGGGSVLDATKYMAAGAKADFDPWLFFTEKKERKIKDALPVITVLTLSATGSEMDGGGVISNPETHEKLGRMEDILRPKASFLNPELTYTVSAYQTACGAADILSHIMEVYFAPEKDLYMLDGVMEALMKTVIKFAPVAIENPEDYEARANLMWASSWAINGFLNGGKSHEWSVHPMEHELSAFYDITHGLGLAILTPRWLKYCLSDKTAEKVKSFGVKVFGIDESLPAKAAAKVAVKALSDFFFKTLKLPGTLKEIGIGEENLEIMAKKAVAVKGGFIDGFIKLGEQDVVKIYKMCL